MGNREERRGRIPRHALVAAAMMAAPAAAAASPSSVRLLAGGLAPASLHAAAGTRLAGVEIRLSPDAVTYWRSPGEAGVPPQFDFAGSDNVAEARVLYPAPEKIEEGGSTAFGYRADVMFPVEVRPIDPGKPARLRLKLDYAVCTTLCLPATATDSVSLPAAPATRDQGAVGAALAGVPAVRRLGDGGPLAVTAVRPLDDRRVDVEAVAPPGDVTLFPEAPSPAYAAAAPGRRAGDGSVHFEVSFDPPPTRPLPVEPLRLTLVGAGGAIEVAVPLDAVLATP